MDRSRHTLLVVDDEPDVVKSVQDLLRYEYHVVGVTRPADGLLALRREDVHIVMTDQRMPEMTGVEFLRNVRQQCPNAMRLLFTAYADIRAVIDSINVGNVFRYIVKPWDPEELQTVIREAADRYDLAAERKRLLDELERSNLELKRINAELLESNELKLNFIKVASHELRTPLTILLGLNDIALMSKEGGPFRGFLERMRAAGQRLARLVEQITAMLSAGQFHPPLDRRATDLAALLRQGAEDVRPFIDLRRQTLRLELAEDLGSLLVEEGKIRDCINHLLMNAIKFTPDGGRIVLAGRRTEEGDVEIKVSDTGIGIEPKALSHIFDPFFTGFDVAHHSSGQFEFGRKGLGLGLSLVKAFVELHGGTISLTSEPGKGTTFLIRLPASSTPESP